MASTAHTTPARSPERDWITHHGIFAPVPSGTRIEAELFSGDRLSFVTGTVCFDEAGNAEPQDCRKAYNAWRYRDGGPQAPKIKAYRVIGGQFHEQTLQTREEAIADLACEVEAQRRAVMAAH